MESGGKYDAQNPNSTAGGVGQFLDSTWLTYAKKAGATGTAAQILAMKKDTSDTGKAFQDKVLDTFTRDNAAKLTANGVPVTASSLYAMHHMGEGNAIKILKSSDGTPMTNFVTSGTLRINGLSPTATVGQYKEWLARKMGGPVPVTDAARNAIRANDQTQARITSLPDWYRQKKIVEYNIDLATKTGNTQYLNNIPPEMITATAAADIGVARKQIAAANYTAQRQALALQKEQREQETYDGKVAINKRLIDGQAIDLSDPAIRNNPELFSYALEAKGKIVNPVAAAQALSGVRDGLADAASTGNWTRLNPAWTSQPSNKELNTWIANHGDLSPEDRIKLINGDAAKIVDQGQLSVSKEYTDYFKDNFETSYANMDKAMENKEGAAGAYGVSFLDVGKRAYNRAIQDGIKAYSEDHNGQLPIGKSRQDIIDRADKKAREAVDLLQKSIQSDGSRENVRAAQETTEDKYIRSGGNKPSDDSRPNANPPANAMTEDQATKAGYKDTGRTITSKDGKTLKQMTDDKGNVTLVAPAGTATAQSPNVSPTATPENSHNYTQAPPPKINEHEIVENVPENYQPLGSTIVAPDGRVIQEYFDPMKPDTIVAKVMGKQNIIQQDYQPVSAIPNGYVESSSMFRDSDGKYYKTYTNPNNPEEQVNVEFADKNAAIPEDANNIRNRSGGEIVANATKSAVGSVGQALNAIGNYIAEHQDKLKPNIKLGPNAKTMADHEKEGVGQDDILADLINFLSKHQDKLKNYIQLGPNAKRLSDYETPPVNSGGDYIDPNQGISEALNGKKKKKKDNN